MSGYFMDLMYQFCLESETFVNRIVVDDDSFINSNTRPNEYDFIPELIQHHISNYCRLQYYYKINILNSTLHFYFSIEDPCEKVQLKFCIEKIIFWFYILKSKFKHDKTSREDVNIFLYLTSLEKHLPIHPMSQIERNNINTAFTNSNEIVIYRKEEWFYSFVHETIHLYDFDFAKSESTISNQIIRDIFQVKTEVNLNEAYTDSWTKILHICLHSYGISGGNFNLYKKTCECFLQTEIDHSLTQTVKILKFMKLTYMDLLNKEKSSTYYENSKFFAYYVLTSIIVFHFEEFIDWCSRNNTRENILNFSKGRQVDFANFIKSKYRNQLFLNNMDLLYNVCDEYYPKSLKKSFIY